MRPENQVKKMMKEATPESLWLQVLKIKPQIHMQTDQEHTSGSRSERVNSKHLKVILNGGEVERGGRGFSSDT